MNKKELTEADIRTKFITPALVAPDGTWDGMTQLREEIYFTKGRVIVRGKTVKRGKAKQVPRWKLMTLVDQAESQLATALLEALVAELTALN